MSDHLKAQQVSLEAKDPFELRVDLGQHVSETEVRSALASGDLGFVHSFTTGSTVDGPGVRVVAWLTGCQFRCLYCHNPDTWRMTNGVPVTVERAKAQLGKYRHGLKMMKGGFTVSGGEPLMQDRFVVRLFTVAKAMGIHTALDSNGYLGSRLTDEDLEKIDLILLDIKAWDSERHRQLTGMDVDPVLNFARRLASRRTPVWLRYVLCRVDR
jgi:pyruvate formate lyase activating enzyme